MRTLRFGLKFGYHVIIRLPQAAKSRATEVPNSNSSHSDDLVFLDESSSLPSQRLVACSSTTT